MSPRFYAPGGDQAMEVLRPTPLRASPPDPTTRRSGGGLRFPQIGGLGPHPALQHQRLTQPRASRPTVPQRPPHIVMAADRAIHRAATHQRCQRIRRGRPAIRVPLVAAMADRSARGCRDPLQPHHMLTDPQSVPVQHRQVVGADGQVAAGRRSGGRLRGPNEQRGRNDKRHRATTGGEQHTKGRCSPIPPREQSCARTEDPSLMVQ
jgi:hypothetical protein